VLLNGPARPGQGLEQHDIDAVMNGAVTAQAHAHRVATAPGPDPLAPLSAISYEEKVALFT
jgi:hypothetical protein